MITLSSSVTSPAQHRIVAPVDKLVHFAEFLTIGLLFARASIMTWDRPQRARVAAIGALVGAAFGLSDELHQAFVPGRTPSLGDLLADVAGACVGAAVYFLLTRPKSAPRATQAESTDG